MRWLGSAIWLLALYFLSYHVQQADFYLLILSASVAFGGMMVMLSTLPKTMSILLMGLFARILVLPSFPTLSDDIYRYLWDGLCWLDGINAYTHSPVDIAHIIGRPDLLSSMNSPEYFTIYPTIPQVLFGVSAWVSNGDVYGFQVILKILLLTTEALGVWWLLKKQRKVIPYLGLWVLNPLVIIETYANAHFEILLLIPLTWGLSALQKNEFSSSALALATGIGTKLVPLMLTPLFAWQARLRSNMFTFLLWLGAGVGVLMMPMWIPLLFSNDIFGSVDLFFRKFEFNASIYYLARSLGYVILGYNAIAYVGPILGLTALLGILLMSVTDRTQIKNVFATALWIYAIYFALSTTIHPWYALTPLGIALFTSYRWPVLWSYLVFFSYSVYGLADNQWPMFIFLEYGLLGVFMIWEVYKKKVRR